VVQLRLINEYHVHPLTYERLLDNGLYNFGQKKWCMCSTFVVVRSGWHSPQLVHYVIIIKIREPKMSVNYKVFNMSGM
jgi:hypothetical protein